MLSLWVVYLLEIIPTPAASAEQRRMKWKETSICIWLQMSMAPSIMKKNSKGGLQLEVWRMAAEYKSVYCTIVMTGFPNILIMPLCQAVHLVNRTIPRDEGAKKKDRASSVSLYECYMNEVIMPARHLI